MLLQVYLEHGKVYEKNIYTVYKTYICFLSLQSLMLC